MQETKQGSGARLTEENTEPTGIQQLSPRPPSTARGCPLGRARCTQQAPYQEQEGYSSAGSGASTMEGDNKALEGSY